MNVKDLKDITLDRLSDECRSMCKQVFDATEGRLRIITLAYDTEGEMHILSGETDIGTIGILLTAGGMHSRGVLNLDDRKALAKIVTELSASNVKANAQKKARTVVDDFIEELKNGL